MEDLNSVLGNDEAPAAPPVVDDEVTEGEIEDETTGEEEEQVAAATVDDEPEPSKVKSELAALAKERERIRQKEAALDNERAQLAEQQQQQREQIPPPNQELKELRKQHRDVLVKLMLDPEDDEAVAEAEALEDRMEELRTVVISNTQKTQNAEEKAQAEYNQTYQEIHEQYPFLDTESEQFNPELNADINAMYYGAIQMGTRPVDALRKAVATFAPAYADQLGGGKKQPVVRAAQRSQTTKPDTTRLSRTGFSEERSMGRRQANGLFTGPTPLDSILSAKQ